MKETVKASLAGIGFVFDRDAFGLLEGCLESLSQTYAANPDGQEIIADIEARIVELILSRQNAETVVGSALVHDIVTRMGIPEEAPAPDGPLAGDGEVFPRRLYRDRENRKLGGVCSGLARYFDIDPVLVRVGMFIPVFLLILLPTLGIIRPLGFLGSLFGAFCLLYLILWMAVPVAKTPRQKLEMQGRRITASEIEREMYADSARRAEQPAGSVLARFFGVIRAIFLFCVKFFLIIIGASLGLAALVLVIGIFGLAVGAPWVVTHGIYTDDFAFTIGNMSMPAAGFSIMMMLLIVIPLVMLVYQMMRAGLHRRNNSTLMWILGGAWVLLAVFSGITILENDQVFRSWRGVSFGSRGKWHRGVNTTGTEEGWEIYERNVQLYRDSLERARSEMPQAVTDPHDGTRNEILFDEVRPEDMSPPAE